MKHFRSYSEFKLQEKYEGVEVSTTRYERVHGKKPRGNGMWAFYLDPVGDEPIFTPSAMNYTDAIKWASLKARNMGKKVIYVGESVNEEVNPKFKDEVIFSVDDDKLDQMLNARFSRQLDYKDVGSDSYYILSRKDFDRFIDFADSSGFDVDYENSEDTVVYVQESVVNEGSDEQVKKECISRLSDFFRVSPNALSHLKFDGKDPIKDVTKALNATSYEGAEQYYRVAIQMAKKDLGIRESLNEATEYAVMLTGGSIGDKPRPKDPRGYVGVEVSADERLYSKDDAKETAKRMNKDLSPGEKRYYGLKYVVVPVANGKFVRENVITEGQALIFDIVEPEFNDLKNKISDLNKKTVDLKWRKALDQIQREVEKLEFFISKYDKQLGAIETNESLNEREYSDEERKDMADKGLALPDGSFPIKDLEDLKNAIQAYGRSKDQSATAKFIVKRAKALSAEDLIPDTEDFQKALKETITEGNAFLAARAKAIEEDAEEFEFNGKKYPVLNRPKKLNEELSDNDAYKIIDIGSKFSKEVGGHLLATQTFDTANDFVDYLLSEFIPKKDHPKFLKSVKSLMESDSSEEDTDEEYIDPATLPQSVKDYVSSNYSDAKITKAESDEDGFEVYLSNGLELVFGPDEKFIKAVKES